MWEDFRKKHYWVFPEYRYRKTQVLVEYVVRVMIPVADAKIEEFRQKAEEKNKETWSQLEEGTILDNDNGNPE